MTPTIAPIIAAAADVDKIDLPPVLLWDDLVRFGLTPGSKAHAHKLIKDGLFPRPFKWTPNRNGWTAEQMREHLRRRIAASEAVVTEQQKKAAAKSIEARRAKRGRRQLRASP
jgi:predicted DNA-binding transcriptional regulator AlpA